MLLTLEIVSANGAALGANRRKTVGAEGAQIGRSKENDWVIADQYISRVNARIHCMNGAFYIEGLGRNPLALRDAGNIVNNNELQPLRDGDRFFLDQYEIQATISGQATLGPTVANAPDDDPFGTGPLLVPNARPTNAGIGAGIGDVLIDTGGGSSGSTLDPLQLLGIEPAAKAEPPLPPIDIQQQSVIHDVYIPQAISTTGNRDVGKPSAGGGDGIPDDWLNDSTVGSPVPPARAPTEAPRRQAGPSTAIPPGWDNIGFTHIEPRSPVNRPQGVQSPNQNTVVDPTEPSSTGGPFKTPPTSGTQTPWPPTVPPQVRPQPPHVPPTISSQPQGRQPPPSLTSADSIDAQSSLGQLLRAAGLPSAQMTPEIAAEIGEALRIVVQGVMDVLHSRAEIKSELRMAMTRMQSHENNPLKFSPNVESALHTLLVERNRGYMPTTRAFQEAFNDIRNHQFAVLQGIRVAFESLLEHFHPVRIEEQMEAHGRRGGLLNIGSKARFRDYYGELFEELTKDPEASFRRLFGEAFAQAYEAQIENFALSNRSKGRE